MKPELSSTSQGPLILGFQSDCSSWRKEKHGVWPCGSRILSFQPGSVPRSIHFPCFDCCLESDQEGQLLSAQNLVVRLLSQWMRIWG